MAGRPGGSSKRNLLGTITNAAGNLLEFIPVFGLAFIFVMIIAQIVSRELDRPIAWAEEAARVASAWVVFTGAYLVLVQGEHLEVDFFVRLLPERWRVIPKLLADLVCACSLCVVVYSGVNTIAVLYGARTPVARIPAPFLFASTVMGAVLMLVFYAREMVKVVRRVIVWRVGRKP